MSEKLSVVFMGTPQFSVPSLQMLATAGCQITAVLTQPDRPRGRGHHLQPSAVKEAATAMGIPVYQPQSLRKGEDAETALQLLQSLAPDLIVVTAYGQLLPPSILTLPRYGCINLHASLLPRWRGAAPMQRAILAGDAKTGVTAMQMAVGLDTGDMLYRLETPIGAEETTATLHDRLAQLSAQVLRETLVALEQGTLHAEPQDDTQSCVAEKITKEMSRLDFSLPAQTLDRTIRAITGYAMLDGKRVKFLGSKWDGTRAEAEPGTIVDARTMRVVCGDGCCLCPTVVQMEGAKAMPVADFLRGVSLSTGMRLQAAAL